MSECFVSVVFDLTSLCSVCSNADKLSWFPMEVLKTLVEDVPWMAELFGLNVSFELALLPFDVDHILRFVFLCSFPCGIPFAFVVGLCLFFMWRLTVSRFPMKPRLEVNGWPSLDVWVLRFRGVWLFDLTSLCSLCSDADKLSWFPTETLKT